MFVEGLLICYICLEMRSHFHEILIRKDAVDFDHFYRNKTIYVTATAQINIALIASFGIELLMVIVCKQRSSTAFQNCNTHTQLLVLTIMCSVCVCVFTIMIPLSTHCLSHKSTFWSILFQCVCSVCSRARPCMICILIM